MKVNVQINLNIESPDSTGFSVDVSDLIYQMMRDMLDTRHATKLGQIHALYDDERTEDIVSELFYAQMEEESIGSYQISLREPSLFNKTLIEVPKPAFPVGTKVMVYDHKGDSLDIDGVVVYIRTASVGLYDNGDGRGLRTSHSTYYYTIERPSGEKFGSISEYQLRLALTA